MRDLGGRYAGARGRAARARGCGARSQRHHSSTSSIWSTERTRCGASSAGLAEIRTFCGRHRCGCPARSAASAFSRTPPTGSTRPRSVTSPVIATSCRTRVRVASEMIAVAIAIPAEGPSFGIAPAGMCRWTSLRAKMASSKPSSLLQQRA
jgi:hypothetical protein